jgi:3-phenylpropionate/trans-cinnamate dioxygenase ferredoxin reductase subunit
MVSRSGGLVHVVIVGNGIAGVTTARHLRKRDPNVRITLVSGETELHWSRPALMYVFMGHMRFQDTEPYPRAFFAKNRIDLLKGWVTSLDVEGKCLVLGSQRTLSYDKLVLALGSTPNRFGWPGQELGRVHGMYSAQDLASLEQLSASIHRGAIVGGGLIGVELAEMLHVRGKAVTMLVREGRYWDNVLPDEEADMVSAVIREAGIDLRLETELTEIVDNGAGEAGAVVDSTGDQIPVEFVGLTAGVRPNIAAATSWPVETARGILVDWTLRTSVEDIYACGDCAEIQTGPDERNLIQAVWYTGRMQGEVVAANLCGQESQYDPGIWFNSAKFFELEYQVYGSVPNSQSMTSSGSLETLFWGHKNGRHALRLNHVAGCLVGVNGMGIRLRHRVCEQWIKEERPIEWVVKNLKQAHFDPEFYRKHYKAVQRQFERAA